MSTTPAANNERTPTPHTPIPWSIGRTLSTQQTRRWTAEEVAANDRVEGSMVFSNFFASDQGRSRIKVAVCVGENAAANAAFIVEACNAYAQQRERIERLEAGLKEIDKIAYSHRRGGMLAAQRLARQLLQPSNKNES